MEVHDWERFAAGFAPGFRNIDRRKMVRLELDRDQYLESMRVLFEMTSTTTEVLATRGSRLALVRVQWKGSDDSVGPSEGEFVLIIEVDDRGSIAALLHFDSRRPRRRLRRARRALRRRRGRPFEPSLASRDWEQLSSALA